MHKYDKEILLQERPETQHPKYLLMPELHVCHTWGSVSSGLGCHSLLPGLIGRNESFSLVVQPIPGLALTCSCILLQLHKGLWAASYCLHFRAAAAAAAASLPRTGCWCLFLACYGSCSGVRETLPSVPTFCLCQSQAYRYCLFPRSNLIS